MKDYRIREEVKTSRDKKKSVSRFYPEYNAGLKWIPYWVAVVRGYYGSAESFTTMEAAKEAIEKSIAKEDKKLIYSKDIIYKVCIEKSKKSIDLC